MDWKLETVEPRECTLDDSGVYTVIYRVIKTENHKEYEGTRVCIRVDVLQQREVPGAPDDSMDEPIRSFVGNGNDVRKAVIEFLQHYQTVETMTPDNKFISLEHASYIGYEIARAEADENYIQD